MAFERLNKELEVALELIGDAKNNDQIKISSDGLPKVTCINIYECSKELIDLGHLKKHRLSGDGDPEVYAYHITLKGRNYWGELRRYRILTYVPLIISGALGMLGAILGVLLGWHLGHL